MGKEVTRTRCLLHCIRRGQKRERAVVREHGAKLALDSRAKELEKSLDGIEDSTRRQQIEDAARTLRPKLCTVGLLFFGLLHESVQSRFDER